MSIRKLDKTLSCRPERFTDVETEVGGSVDVTARRGRRLLALAVGTRGKGTPAVDSSQVELSATLQKLF
jgi:hypothetical protein